jgi:hypothetical protein
MIFKRSSLEWTHHRNLNRASIIVAVADITAIHSGFRICSFIENYLMPIWTKSSQDWVAR